MGRGSRYVAVQWLLEPFQIRKQAVEFAFDHVIAFAHTLFEPGPVQHLDMAVVVMDEARVLQFQCCFRDARPSDTEHVCDQFLRHAQLVRRKAVEAEQELATELLIDRMMPVANRSLGHLRDERLGIAQQQALKWT